MPETRLKQRVACDGVRSIWTADHRRLMLSNTPQKLSIDGVLTHKEGARYVHTVHSRHVMASQKSESKVPRVRLHAEKTLRSLIDGVYIPQLRTLRRVS